MIMYVSQGLAMAVPLDVIHSSDYIDVTAINIASYITVSL